MIARVGFLILVCLAASVKRTEAIEIAIPSDMYEYTTTTGLVNPGAGFYCIDPTTWGSPNRGYSMMMNSWIVFTKSDLVWIMQPDFLERPVVT